jgi:hypothetical protein
MSRPTLRRAARGAVVGTTGLAVALVPLATLGAASPASAAAPAANPARCASGALPTDVNGRPAVFTKGLPTGAWVWHDSKGFHLRVTHATKTKLTFTGTVKSSGQLSAKRIRAEKHDVIWRSSKKNAVKFTLRNLGGVDGIDFKTGCAAKVTLTLKAAGAKLTTAQIFLGADAVNPTANPTVIQRSGAAAPTCATGALPTSIPGRPAAFRAGLPAGAWVWHDAQGYHLRVTQAAKSQLNFTGTISSSGKLTAKRIRAERNDVLWRNNKQNAVKFTLRNYGAVDGIDFKAGCAKNVTITLNAQAPKTPVTKLATTQIHLGANGTNPTSNPFTITRS